MKKRVLSLFMALALCLTLLPTAALAEENTTEPSTQLTEPTPVPQEPKTPDQGENTETPNQPEEPSQDEPPAADEPPAVQSEPAPQAAEVPAENAVAEVDGVNYNDIQEAFEKVKQSDGGTLKLLANCETPNMNQQFDISGNYTLDLNGCTLKGQLELKTKESNLTIQDSKGGGKLQAPGNWDTLSVKAGSATIKSGTLASGSNASPIAFGDEKDCGTLNIEGGSFAGYVYIGYVGGKTVISGGDFHELRVCKAGDKKSNVSISGGTFDTVTLNYGITKEDILASGYTFVYRSDGSAASALTNVRVVSKETVNALASLTVDGTKTHYGTFEEALTAAQQTQGGTLTLLNHVTTTQTDINSGTFTLDLNGHTLTSGYNATLVVRGGSLTIQDSKGGGVISSTSSDGNAVWCGGGNVTILGGSFPSALYWESGTVSLQGGAFCSLDSKAGSWLSAIPERKALERDGQITDASAKTIIAPTGFYVLADHEEHNWQEGRCACGREHTDHTWEDGKCTVCHLPCSHKDSWTYTASGATITATCSKCSASGGSVTISASDAAYDRRAKAATVTASDDWKGPAVDEIAITYKKGNEALTSAPTNAGNYTASITLGEGENAKTASVEYEIKKVAPKIASWSPYTGPLPAYNGEQVKNPTGLPMTFGEFADITGFKWYQATKNEDSSYTKGEELSAPPTDAGDYYIEAIFKEGTNTTAGIAGTGLTVRPMLTEKVVNAKEYPVYANRAYTYEIDLNSYLTDLHLGTGVTYTKTNGDLPDYFKAGELSISSDGKLTVPVKNTTTTPLPSTIATIVVWVKSSNYGRITLSVPIQMVAKKSEDLAVGMTGWTYGESANGPEFSAPEGVTATVTYAKADGTALGERPTNAGDYTVKVQYETNDNIYTGTAKFTIEPKSIAGATVTLKKDGNSEAATTLELPYTGAQQTVKVGSVTLKGMTDALAENMDYTVDTNVNGTNADQYTVTVTGKGNYKDTAQVTWKITPAPLTITGATTESRAYKQGDKAVKITSVTFNGVVPSGTTLQGTDYDATGEMNDDKAGDRKDVNVTVELKGDAAKNYTLQNNTFETTVNIKLADYGDKTASGFAKKGTSGTVDLSALIVEGGKLSLGTATDTNRILDGDPTVEGKTLKFKFNNSATADQTATVPVKVTNIPNYNGYDITVTLTVTDKDVPTLNVKNITKPYDGKEVSTDEAHGAATFSGQTVAGTWSWKEDAAAPKNVVDSGIYTIVFKPTDTTKYAEAQTTITVTINKALITVTALNKQITVGQAVPDLGEPKPNKDYTVTGLVGNDQLGGTLKMKYQKNGQDVTVSTNNPGSYDIVITGVATPTNGDNYTLKLEKGTLTIQTQSSGGSTGGGSSSSGGGSSSDGGGGGGSSSSGGGSGKTDTTTTTKPDGTTVKTETKKDGTKIQTETKKDGSVTKTTTNPNGSSVTETKAADGSTGTVKTDKNGNTEAETKVSTRAVEDAKKSGEAVKAPVEVKATRNSNTAPTVKIELPRNSGDTKVEIPVTNVKPGTVAVIVHPDGTEEIVKNSLPTEDGIQLTINGGATVKIVDNSKDFIDTRNHWAKDAIDFVSARGLVNGMSATIYAPNASTTRAQLWTILARQNDADLTGGATWFENAQNWAKEKGISDGTNPNGTINRAQMVTMLWRAMGQSAAGSAANFTDVPADAYYAQAVAWAVENGITAGVGNGRFDPNSTCTRGQIATFLHRSYLSK